VFEGAVSPKAKKCPRTLYVTRYQTAPRPDILMSLASLLPPSAEGGCARRHATSARPLWCRSLRSTHPTGVGGSPAAPDSEQVFARVRILHHPKGACDRLMPGRF
jgi:hypothetical protein